MNIHASITDSLSSIGNVVPSSSCAIDQHQLMDMHNQTDFHENYCNACHHEDHGYSSNGVDIVSRLGDPPRVSQRMKDYCNGLDLSALTETFGNLFGKPQSVALFVHFLIMIALLSFSLEKHGDISETTLAYKPLLVGCTRIRRKRLFKRKRRRKQSVALVKRNVDGQDGVHLSKSKNRS